MDIAISARQLAEALEWNHVSVARYLKRCHLGRKVPTGFRFIMTAEQVATLSALSYLRLELERAPGLARDIAKQIVKAFREAAEGERVFLWAMQRGAAVFRSTDENPKVAEGEAFDLTHFRDRVAFRICQQLHVNEKDAAAKGVEFDRGAPVKLPSVQEFRVA